MMRLDEGPRVDRVEVLGLRREEVALQVRRDGVAVVEGVLPVTVVEEWVGLLEELEKEEGDEPARRRRNGVVYGQRDLLGRLPGLRELVNGPRVRALVDPIVGKGAIPVRALLFDKTPGANWGVPWHRDITIVVKRREEAPGYRGWSMKAGLLHVQPPVEVLERMLTLRLHLDRTDAENGPLRVLPGSHCLRGADPTELEPWRTTVEARCCVVGSGGVVLMRPLLLHASGAARSPSHRRVIHVEFAGGPLPGGVEWNEIARYQD